MVNSELISLDLGRLEITDLQDGIFQDIKTINHLYLHGNDFSSIPENIFNDVPNLLGLNLPNNNILSIKRDDFENLQNLNWLNLSANKIKVLPSKVFSYPYKLNSLNLSFNQIDKIHSNCFDSLKDLEILKLNKNTIKKVNPKNFEKITKLRILNLSNNQLKKLNPSLFQFLASLEELDLSFNKIENLPEDIFGNQKRIKKLSLMSNNLSIISFSEKDFPSLESLKLDNNPFSREKKITNSNSLTTKELEELEDYLLPKNSSDPHNTDNVSDLITQINMDVSNQIINFESDEFIDLFYQSLNDSRFDGGLGKVSNNTLAKRSGKSIEEVTRIMESLIIQERITGVRHEDSGTPADYTDDYWVVMQQQVLQKNVQISNKCLLCQHELENIFDRCPNCDLRCEICKLAIKSGENWDTCSSQNPEACYQIFHANEFNEWVKIYGKCPSCSHPIDLKLYDLTRQHSDKVKTLISQDLDISSANETESSFILPLTVQTYNLLLQVYAGIDTTKNMVKKMEISAIDNHNQILSELQPITKEIVLIRSFSESINNNVLTKDGFLEGIKEIESKFDLIQENLELVVNSHKKNKSKLEKIKKTAKGKSKDVKVDALVERTGLKSRILNYVKKPNLSDLRSIMSRIKTGIVDKSGDPSSWIKLASLFMI